MTKQAYKLSLAALLALLIAGTALADRASGRAYRVHLNASPTLKHWKSPQRFRSTSAMNVAVYAKGRELKRAEVFSRCAGLIQSRHLVIRFGNCGDRAPLRLSFIGSTSFTVVYWPSRYYVP